MNVYRKLRIWIEPTGLAVLLIMQFSYNGAVTALTAATFGIIAVILASITFAVCRPDKPTLAPLLTICIMILSMFVWYIAARYLAPSVHFDSGLFATEIVIRIGYVCLFAAGVFVAAKDGTKASPGGALVLIGSVWALAYLCRYYLDVRTFVSISNPAGRFTLSLKNANAAGCILGVLILINVAELARYTKNLGKAVRPMLQIRNMAFVFTLLIYGICLLLTQSRLAICATLVIAAVLVGRRYHDVSGRSAKLSALPVAALVGAVLVATIVLQASGWQFGERMAHFAQDAAQRRAMLSYFFALSMERPIWGHGLGSFRQFNEMHLNIENASVYWNLGAAHNFIVNSAIEAGWVCVALGFGAIIAFGQLMRERLRLRPFEPDEVGLLAAVTLSVICSMFDIALEFYAIASSCCLFLGCVAGNSLRVIAASKDARRGDPADEGRSANAAAFRQVRP